MRNESVTTLRQRRDALLKQLGTIGPFVQGSYSVRKVKCGKPNCHCARGDLHEARVLTSKVRGKTKTTHVPRDLQDEVEAWATQYKQLKSLIKDISDLSERIIRMHVPTSRAVARNRARANQTLPGCTGKCSDTTSPGSSDG